MAKTLMKRMHWKPWLVGRWCHQETDGGKCPLWFSLVGNLRDVTKICIRSRSTNLMIKYFAIIVECFNGTVTCNIWHNNAFINIWYYFIFKAVLHALLQLIYINANDCTSLEISVTSIYTRLHTKPMSNWKPQPKIRKLV